MARPTLIFPPSVCFREKGGSAWSQNLSLTASLPASVYLPFPTMTTFLDIDSHERNASGHQDQKGHQGHVHNYKDPTSQVPHTHSIAQSVPSTADISASCQDEKLHLQYGSFTKCLECIQEPGRWEGGESVGVQCGAGREALTLAIFPASSTSDVPLQVFHTGH